MIGPGGENLVKYACIMHGPFDAAGRGGLGAVMGSKNLKAVAVRGNKMPPIINAAGISKMVRWLKENMELVKALKEFGTGVAMPRFAKRRKPSHKELSGWHLSECGQDFGTDDKRNDRDRHGGLFCLSGSM